MLTIYGNPLSSPCNKVRYACDVLGADYAWVSLDFAAGDLKTPEHLARHPAGKIPVIDDNGFVLFESDAICRYLSAKHGGRLVPEDLQTRAVMDQWNAFCIQHVGLAASKVLYNRVLVPMFNLDLDETSLREGGEWLDRYLPIVDRRLGEAPFLAGDALTLADLSLLSILDPAEQADIAIAPYPLLDRWRSGLQAQDFWKKAHA